MAAPDFAPIVSEIAGAAAAVGMIGIAVLMVLASLKIMQWVRASIDGDSGPSAGERFAAEGDEYQELDEFDWVERDAVDLDNDVEYSDDWSGFDPDSDMITDEIEFHCFHCGWDAYQDDALNAYSEGQCSKCGEPMGDEGVPY